MNQYWAEADAGELEQYCEQARRLPGSPITNLVESVAKGMPADSIAPVVKQYQAEAAKLDVVLRSPKPAPPNLEKLREALPAARGRVASDAQG